MVDTIIFSERGYEIGVHVPKKNLGWESHRVDAAFVYASLKEYKQAKKSEEDSRNEQS